MEHARIADLERQLSETLAAQTERDRHISRLTDQLAQAEANAAEAKKSAGLELRELQAKLDELMLSRDEHLRTLEQAWAPSALQKAIPRAADANECSEHACEQIGEYETKLAEVRAELEEKKSELKTIRLRLTNAENDLIKSKAEADKLRAQTATGSANRDEDQVTHRLLERVRAIEAEMTSKLWNEKSIEDMVCRNEG